MDVDEATGGADVDGETVGGGWGGEGFVFGGGGERGWRVVEGFFGLGC